MATSIRSRASVHPTTTPCRPRFASRTSTASQLQLFTHGVITWTRFTAYRGAFRRTARTSRAITATPTSTHAIHFTGFLSYQLPGSSHGPRELTHGLAGQLTPLLPRWATFTVKASGDISGTNEGTIEPSRLATQLGDIRDRRSTPTGSTCCFRRSYSWNLRYNHRNAYYGPGYSDVDFLRLQDTKIKEKVTIQFRAEMFNLFNASLCTACKQFGHRWRQLLAQ